LGVLDTFNEPYVSSNTLRTASAISRFKIGLEIKARIPMLNALCSFILELKPVQSITGISDLDHASGKI
jgi:hypothetical protein